MIKNRLLVLVLMLLTPACISQEVIVEQHCDDDGHFSLDGTIEIIPEWDAGSAATYARWLTNEEDRWKVQDFRTKIRQAVAEGFGAEFPRADLPNVDEELALALVSRNDDVDRTRLPTIAMTSRTSTDDPLTGIEIDFESAVHEAINRHNPRLHAAGYEPSKREVSYVIEQGVTYCIYGSFVVVDDGQSQPDWWKVKATYDGETVTLFLNVMVIVTKVA